MRLSADEIKQGILHPEQMVRDAAVRYFSDSFSEDPTVMPLAIQAVETHGWDETFQFGSCPRGLAQTDDTLLWIIEQLGRLGEPKTWHDMNLRVGLSSMIACADPGLLMKHEATIMGLPGLLAECQESVVERVRLTTVDTAYCWRALEDFCEESKRLANEVNLAQANRLVEAIARDESCAERVLSILAHKVEDYSADDPMAWMEGRAICLAGLLRLEAAVPMLIAKLVADGGSSVNEQCLYALARIGTDSTVEAICGTFPTAPWHYKLYGSGVLKRIHSDLAVSKSLELLEQEESSDIRVNLTGAALASFSSDGIPPAWQLSVRGIHEFRKLLVAVATLMGVSFAELEDWRKEEREHDEDVNRRMGLWNSPHPTPKPKTKVQALDRLLDPPAPLPPVKQKQVGRNDRCPCGSGKKYKRCCMGRG